MLIAGIVGQANTNQTANLINTILSSTGRKISVIDSGNFTSLEPRTMKSYMYELDKNNIDVLILKINLPDIIKDIFNYLHFDIMLYTGKADEKDGAYNEEHVEYLRKIFQLMHEKGTIIVNVDDTELLKVVNGIKYHMVTYGFNSKASITASSIGDMVSEGGFMCCLQRTISAKDGKLVEPKEYMVNFGNNEYDAYNVLAAVTFAVVNGVDFNTLSGISAN